MYVCKWVCGCVSKMKWECEDVWVYGYVSKCMNVWEYLDKGKSKDVWESEWMCGYVSM